MNATIRLAYSQLAHFQLRFHRGHISSKSSHWSPHSTNIFKAKKFFSTTVAVIMASDSDKFTLKSPGGSVPPPPGGYKTMPQYLLPKAKEFAESGKSYWAIDAISKEKRYFDKFDLETGKIASALYKSGLRKGGIVIYMPADFIKLHIFLTGVWRANGVCRASYPDDDPKTLGGRLKDSNCKHILCDPNRVAACIEAVKNVDWSVQIITTGKAPGFLSIDEILEQEDGSACPPLEVTGDDPALMLSTSGTTGPAKSALFTHSSVVRQIHSFTFLPFTETKPNVMFSIATHHSGSLVALGLLASGKTSIVTGQISKELLRDTIVEMQPGLVFAFPTYLLTLVAPEASGYDMTSIELVMTGGGIVTPVMKQAYLQLPNVKDVMILYGLTEVGVTVSNIVRGEDLETPTYRDLPDFAVGRPWGGTEIQIRDTETLEPLGPNQRGEICSYNEYTIHSYYKNPEATKKSYTGRFFRSGDIGYYDEQGFIFVVDRLKEIFKYYNNHISPTELENVIGEHPLVDEVCVIGIADPGGHVPRAFVTLKGVKSPEIAERITEYANSRLPGYKHLRAGLFIIPELPKGKSGKISRDLVAKLKVGD